MGRILLLSVSCLALTEFGSAGEKPVSLWDHREKVVTVAFSPDGKTLATAILADQNAVAVWDVASMTRKTLLADAGLAYHIVFSPDGRQMVLASEGPEESEDRRRVGKPSLMLRDALTGKTQRTFTLRNGEARHVAISPDGKLLATGNGDNTVTLWDAATGQERSILKGHESPLARVLFSPDGKTLASAGSDDATVRLWNVMAGKQQAILTHTIRPHALAFSADGKILVTGGDRLIDQPGEVRRWDVASGKELALVKGVEGPIAALALSPDGKTLAFGTREGVIKLQDWATGQERAVFEGSMNLRQIAFSPDGKTLAGVALSGDPPLIPAGLRLWDLTTGKEKLPPAQEAERDRREALDRQRRAQQTQARLEREKARQELERKLSPAASALLAETVSRARRAEFALVMEQASQACERWQFDRAHDLLNRLLPEPGEEDLRDFGWHYLRQHRAREHVLYKGEDVYLTASAISGDGATVAVALTEWESRKGRGVLLFNAATGKQRALLKNNDRNIGSLCFSPDGRTLIVGENHFKVGGDVHLWDAGSGQLRATLRGRQRSIEVLACSPDGVLLAAGGDGTVNLWNVQERKLLRGIETDRKPISSLAFSPDGKTIASAAEGSATRLWDVERGKEKGVLPHLRGASHIAFAPHTRQLVTSHQDTVVLWDATSLQPISSFNPSKWPVQWVEQGQLLLCGLALYEPLSGKERASFLKAEPTPPPRKKQTATLGTDSDYLRSLNQGQTGIVSTPNFLGDGYNSTVIATRAGRLLAVRKDSQAIRLLDFPLRLSSRQLSVQAPDFEIRLAFSADGRDLLARIGKVGVRRWDASTWEESPAPLHLHKTGNADIDFSARPPRVRVDGVELSLPDFALLGGPAALSGQQDRHMVLGLSPDGRTLVTGEALAPLSFLEKPRLVLRDAATGKERFILTTFKDTPTRHSFAFTADGKRLVTWVDDVVTWDVPTGKELDRIAPPSPVLTVRFAADGKTLETLVLRDSRTPALHLWDVATGETRATLQHHPDFIDPAALTFSPDGRVIATGGADKAVRLWDAQTGHLRLVLRGHPGSIAQVVIRPDGKVIVAVSRGGAMTLWSAGEQ
jgi:WD40 repeat protein